MTRQGMSGVLGVLAILMVGGAGILCAVASRRGKRSGYTVDGFWHWWRIVFAYGVGVGAAAGVGTFVYSVEVQRSVGGGLLACALFSSLMTFVSSQAIFGTYCGTVPGVRFARDAWKTMYVRQLGRSGAVASAEISVALVAHLAGVGR